MRKRGPIKMTKQILKRVKRTFRNTKTVVEMKTLNRWIKQ